MASNDRKIKFQPPPNNVEDLNHYSWRSWFMSVFNRIGIGPFKIYGYKKVDLPPASEWSTLNTDPNAAFSSLVFVIDEDGGPSLEYSDGNSWIKITTPIYGGGVTSVNATAPTLGGFTITGVPINSSGNIVFELTGDLAGLEQLATSGIAVRTGTDTWVTRQVIDGGGLLVTNPAGVAGDITVTLGTPSTVDGSSTNSVTTDSHTHEVNLTASDVGADPAGTATAAVAAHVAAPDPHPQYRLESVDIPVGDLAQSGAVLNDVIQWNGTTWVPAAGGGGGGGITTKTALAYSLIFGGV